MKAAIFPGSFNPFTIGHADIVRRGLQLFDRIVIAVGYNAQKTAAPVPAAPPAAAPVLAAPPAAAPPSAATVQPAPPFAAPVPPAEARLSEIPASLPPLLAQRTAAIERIYADEPRVKVVAYSGLTVDLAAREGARFLLRGVRSVKDFEYERDMAAVNSDLGLETALLIADPRYAHISSSVVRELQAYGRNVTPYLP